MHLFASWRVGIWKFPKAKRLTYAEFLRLGRYAGVGRLGGGVDGWIWGPDVAHEKCEQRHWTLSLLAPPAPFRYQAK